MSSNRFNLTFYFLVALVLVILAVAVHGGEASLGVEADAVMRPLVRVRTAQASGSGVLVYSEDREGSGEYRTFVLTNHHVVDDAVNVVKKWDSLSQSYFYAEENDQVTVEVFTYLRGGRTVIGMPIKADIVAHKASEDIALLELNFPNKVDHIAKMLPEGVELRLLQCIYAVGCSLGADPLVTAGFIIDLEELIDKKPFVMATAQVIYGNSGGGAFTKINDAYYFIGIPSRVRVMRNGQALPYLSYFIPIDRVRKFLKAQHLEFLLDKTTTPTESFDKRAKLQKKQKAD